MNIPKADLNLPITENDLKVKSFKETDDFLNVIKN